MHYYISLFVLLTAYLNELLRIAVSIESPRLIGILMLLMEIVWLTLEVLHLNLYPHMFQGVKALYTVAVHKIILTPLQVGNYHCKFYIMTLQ